MRVEYKRDASARCVVEGRSRQECETCLCSMRCECARRCSCGASKVKGRAGECFGKRSWMDALKVKSKPGSSEAKQRRRFSWCSMNQALWYGYCTPLWLLHTALLLSATHSVTSDISGMRAHFARLRRSPSCRPIMQGTQSCNSHAISYTSCRHHFSILLLLFLRYSICIDSQTPPSQ